MITSDSNPTQPSMPYNGNVYVDGPTTVGIYVVNINGGDVSDVSAATISIITYSEVDPYIQGYSNLGYNSVIFFYNSTTQVPGSIQSYNPGGHTTTITPNSLISSGATNTAIGTKLYILYYSDLQYTNDYDLTPYNLPSQFNPDGNNPGGLQMGYIFTILPCSEPTNLTQMPFQNNQIDISWTAPDDDGGGTGVISYIVAYNVTQINTKSNSTTWTIPADPNGNTYQIQVAAVNEYCGNGGPQSGPFSNTITSFSTPGPPTDLNTSYGNGQVSLSWTAPNHDGGNAISNYIVQYKSSNQDWNTFGHSPTTTTSIIVTGLTNGTLYDFQVAAVNVNGQGTYSMSKSATPSTVPGAPTGLTAHPNKNRQVTLNWIAPIDTGGIAITDYVVQYRPSNKSAWITFAHQPSNATTMIVTGFNNGTLYDFQVAAVNANPNSPGPYSVIVIGISAILYNKCGITGFVPGPPPWSRAGGNNCPNCDSNYGTSACGDTIKPYSTYALDERRKTEILKYKINSAQLSVAQRYTMLSRNALTRKKSWATQTQTYTNPNVDKLPERESEGVTVALECRRPQVLYSLTSDCDVPGPVIPLYIDAKIPLYNYKMQVTPSSGGKQVNKMFDIASLNN